MEISLGILGGRSQEVQLSDHTVQKVLSSADVPPEKLLDLPGLPRCKNLWSFSLFCTFCFPRFYCVDFFVSFTLRHSWVSQVLLPRMSRSDLSVILTFDKILVINDSSYCGIFNTALNRCPTASRVVPELPESYRPSTFQAHSIRRGYLASTSYKDPCVIHVLEQSSCLLKRGRFLVKLPW